MCCASHPPQLPKCGHTGSTRAGCGRSRTIALAVGYAPQLARQRIGNVERPLRQLDHAVALRAEPVDLDLPCFNRRRIAPSRNSSLPEPPAIGEAMTSSTRQPGWPAIQSRTSATARCRAAGSRTMPPFAHGRAPRLELRLDQRHQPGSRTRQRQRHGQRLRQRDEAHVGDEARRPAPARASRSSRRASQPSSETTRGRRQGARAAGRGRRRPHRRAPRRARAAPR